jgi:hypothetical protein
MKDRSNSESLFWMSRILERLMSSGQIHADDPHDLYVCLVHHARLFDEQYDSEGDDGYLEAIKEYTHRILRETYPSKPDTVSQARQMGFTLPNGARIVGTLDGDPKAFPDGENQVAINIGLRYPSGTTDWLACVCFEYRNEWLERDRLLVTTHEPGDEESINEQEHPYMDYSIWISHDDDDDGGTSFDINIWNEDGNTRDESWEKGHVSTEAEAIEIMERIIAAHPEIFWERRPLQDKRSTQSIQE